MARNSTLLNALRASPDPTARRAAEAIESVTQDLEALRLSVARLETPTPSSATIISSVTIAYVN